MCLAVYINLFSDQAHIIKTAICKVTFKMV